MAGGRHIPRYTTSNVESAGDGRLFSPSFEKNFEPIRAVLVRLLSDSGAVLEIGAGTGHHAAHLALALPAQRWLPTDLEEDHLISIEAWRASVRAANQLPALALDAASDWAARPEIVAFAPTTVFCANVLHIAPWAVAEGIARGAGAVLPPGGRLIFYGPFKVAGRHVGEGNIAFDAALRTDNPDWGVRDTADVAALAAKAGFGPPDLVEMPSNNRMVVFTRL